MTIPHADRAVVDIRKLRDYCLNPLHDEGKHKARVFAAALHDWCRRGAVAGHPLAGSHNP
jgi:hypothetical protein